MRPERDGARLNHDSGEKFPFSIAAPRSAQTHGDIGGRGAASLNAQQHRIPSFSTLDLNIERSATRSPSLQKGRYFLPHNLVYEKQAVFRQVQHERSQVIPVLPNAH